MPHAATFGGSLPGDECDYGFLKVLLYILRGLLLGGSTDFADHDNRAGLGILVEQFQRIDVAGSDDRIATNSDAGRLTQAQLSQLVDRLVGEGSGARDDADATRLVDVTRHDTDFALARGDDSGAVGANQPRAAASQIRP